MASPFSGTVIFTKGNNGTKVFSYPGRKGNYMETSEKIIVVNTTAGFAYSF